MIDLRRRFLSVALLGSSSAIALAPSAAWSTKVLAGSRTTADDPHEARSNDTSCNPLLAHEFRPLMGPDRRPLCDEFSGKVLLVVNTASRCGFTPQFEDLEKLHQQYVERGLRVLGFPSGDFRQELSTEAEVAEFCEVNYGVSFPMFEKIHVTGDQAHPFYQRLAEATGSYPQWNFNKYLIDRNGIAVAHYNSGTMPLGKQLLGDIEALL